MENLRKRPAFPKNFNSPIHRRNEATDGPPTRQTEEVQFPATLHVAFQEKGEHSSCITRVYKDFKFQTKFLMAANEAMAICYPDVSVKQALGVSLFTNTVSTLGTERHQIFLQMAWENQLLSCVALTEVAHGSDTKQMRTTATYDKATQEFVINTPDFEAAKCWVGNLGENAVIANVMVILAMMKNK